MANTNLSLIGLDFADLKTNFKTFLKNNTQFKDIDYEGSNINVLLDLLSYNTYLNSFYTNMVASEMFLDTAQLRDNVVSHAKELNYIPRSYKGADALVTVDITPSTNVLSIVIPKYTSFTARVGSNTFSFSTNESLVVTDTANGVFTANLHITEGVVSTETFVINNSNTIQRFIISNPTVDASSLSVYVYEDNAQEPTQYKYASSILSVVSTSQVYFLQAVENEQYEIVFGDGVFGRRPKDGSTVAIQYKTCSGELPNGADAFVADGAIDGHTNINVSVISAAAGGALSETTESIRFNAPRMYQTQSRAITASDYEVLLKNNFADIESISVYGGEDITPPQYGTVYISVDVKNADGAPDVRKNVFRDFVKERSPITSRIVFIDPEFNYLKINSNVVYNVSTTSKTTFDIQTAVKAAVSSYNSTELSNFKTTLRYSKLVQLINECDASIISNDTTVTLSKRFVPTTKQTYKTIIDTYNPLFINGGYKENYNDPVYGKTLVSSRVFKANLPCIIVDDGMGSLFLALDKSNEIDILEKIGTIDYTTGRVNVNALLIDSFVGNYVELDIKTSTQNVKALQNAIMTIDPRNVYVNAVGVKQ